jgi:probable rRNA maturation factor
VTIEIAWAARTRRPRGLTLPSIRRAAQLALEHGGRAGAGLTIVFVDDAELARMHERWLADSSPTDVITFDLGDAHEGPVGELYVSTERARAVAARRDIDPVREHLLYVVHGALHLCGFDDRSPRERTRMRRAERTVLAKLARAGA